MSEPAQICKNNFEVKYIIKLFVASKIAYS